MQLQAERARANAAEAREQHLLAKLSELSPTPDVGLTSMSGDAHNCFHLPDSKAEPGKHRVHRSASDGMNYLHEISELRAGIYVFNEW